MQPNTDRNSDDQEQAEKEAKLGNATALGGALRLRGYPQGRFFDSYTNFQGIEFRYYLLEQEKSFDWIVEKGVYTSMQIAIFYEQGTVAPLTEMLSEFGVNILVATDIPISKFIFPNSAKLEDLVSLSLYGGNVKNFALAQRKRGIDAEADDFSYLLLNKSNFRGGEISLYFFEKQLEIYYNLTNGEVEPLGFVTASGDFESAESAKVNSRNDGGRWGIYLDDTDSRRDPRIGYRIQYERYNFPSSRGEAPAFYQNDYNLTGFIPLTKKKKGVFVLNQFYSEAVVTQAGTVQPNTDRNSDDQEQAEKEAKLGNATALGGALRLRGYPQGRFFDSYTNFQGIEFRYYLLEQEKSFDWIVEKGVYTSMQIAIFYEQGTVAPNTGELWKNIKNSYGFGTRIVLSSFVFRVDVGFSEEGSEATVFFGYPF